jgi:hypothetical protein
MLTIPGILGTTQGEAAVVAAAFTEKKTRSNISYTINWGLYTDPKLSHHPLLFSLRK